MVMDQRDDVIQGRHNTSEDRGTFGDEAGQRSKTAVGTRSEADHCMNS